MRKLLTVALLFASLSSLKAQNNYQYTADIANIKNDKVAVTLKTPAIGQETVIYSFPKAIPGSYARKDFGRFIEGFTALDKDGKALKIKKLNANHTR